MESSDSILMAAHHPNTNYIPEEEDELRFPPELRGRLEKLIRRMEQPGSPVTAAETASSSASASASTASVDAAALKELEDSVALLEKHLEVVTTKCASLEAQSILVSVQQLDFLARGIAWCLSLSALAIYAWFTWVVTDQLHDAVYRWFSTEGKVEANDDDDVAGRMSVFSFLVGLAWWMIMKLLARGALWALPYFYNEYTHGSAHRRFQVFAIAFIIIARVRMCRWREQVFIIKPQSSNTNNETTETTTTAFSPDMQNGNAVSVSSSLKPSFKVPVYGDGITEEALWEANYEISARFLYVSILRLRGLWTKSAQYLSSRADFMPTSYVRELKRLQDEAPATPWKDILPMLPLKVQEALVDICETPLASASIGQVHTARIKSTGEKVAIKVQHPHARSLILDDLWSLGVILRIVSWMEPDYEFMEILMREWSKEARKELDFTLETENLIDARIAIQKLWNSPDAVQYTHSTCYSPTPVPFQVEIPVPVNDLCNDQVLVMSYCEGFRVDEFDQLLAAGLSRPAVMDGIAQTFAHMMYTTTIFNGDPHPGNLFVRPGIAGGKNKQQGFTLVLLDWGLAKRLTESKRVAFCEMVYAAATFDYGLMMDSYRRIGLQLKRENASLDMENLRFFLRDMAPRDVARRRIKHKIRKDEAHRKTLKKEERVPMKSKAYPGEFFFFVRVNELLHGLGSRFDVDMAYLDLLRPYAERGLRQSYLYNNSNDPARTYVPPLLQGTSYRKCIDNKLEKRLKSCFEELEREGNLVGAQFYAVDSQGRNIANVVAGSLGGLKSHIPMDDRTLVLGFSCTKAIAATMAHIMVQEGYLTYDEPLSERVWDNFCPTKDPPAGLASALELPMEDVCTRWQWKRQISLWHVLTHQAGMWSALPAKMSIKTAADCEYCVAAFEYHEDCPEDTLLPTYAPGIKSEYHYMSFGWLVAGALCGAYAKKHGLKYISFEALYKAVLCSKLSDGTLRSGFRPCGGAGGFVLANTVTNDISASKLLQKRRESLAIGEEEDDDGVDEAVFDRLKEYRGKEFLLDPRIWNSLDGREANMPAAGGRFSAAGLAHFYHDLASGRVLNETIVNAVTTLLIKDTGLASLQGATSSSSTDDDQRTSLGCGYQLMRFDKDTFQQPSAFGHAGVGGSIGFHHKPSGISVGLMLNKADGGRDITKRILKVVGDHFGF